jgi:transposase InsO family protein
VDHQQQTSGQHEFDQLCAALEIEHRLTRPRTPQTNGMVEHCNGRIADILKTHHFMSGEDLEQTLLRLLLLYNEHLPQSAMNSKNPMDAMNMWRTSHPQLFFRPPGSNRPGCDIAAMSGSPSHKASEAVHNHLKQLELLDFEF